MGWPVCAIAWNHCCHTFPSHSAAVGGCVHVHVYVYVFIHVCACVGVCMCRCVLLSLLLKG